MGKKRQEMKVGEWDNITERCPQHRYRFALWAKEEISAWIMIHINRYSGQVAGMLDAAKAGAKVGDAIMSATASCSTLLRLLNSVDEKWDASDWHFACNVVAARVGEPGSGPTMLDMFDRDKNKDTE